MFCKCGCGQKTTLWEQSLTAKGVVKGQPRDWIKGHYQSAQSLLPKPSATCHPDRETRALGLCASCYNSLVANKTPERRERKLAAGKARHKAAKESAAPGVWEAKQRNRVLKHRYGIDSETYEAMLAAQEGCCAICRKPSGETKATRLYVDHNHSTKTTRQLLCPGCNTAVGVVEKDIERFEKVVDYLVKHSGTPSHWLHIQKIMGQREKSNA